jgi:hypothetical protein
MTFVYDSHMIAFRAKEKLICHFILPEFDQTENGTLSKILIEGKTH